MLARAGDAAERKAANALAVIATIRGRHEEAVDGFRRAAALAARLGDRRGEAVAADNLAIVHHRSGHPGPAIAANRRAQALAEQADDLEQLVDLLFNSVDPLLAAGRAQEAHDAAARGVELARQRGHPSLSRGLANLALAAEALGHDDDTRVHLLDALAEIGGGGSPSVEVELLTELGRLELRQRDLDRAREYYESAVERSRQAEIPLAVARATEGLGDVAQAAGDADLAFDNWERALDLYEQVSEELAAGLRRRLRMTREDPAHAL